MARPHASLQQWKGIKQAAQRTMRRIKPALRQTMIQSLDKIDRANARHIHKLRENRRMTKQSKNAVNAVANRLAEFALSPRTAIRATRIARQQHAIRRFKERGWRSIPETGRYGKLLTSLYGQEPGSKFVSDLHDAVNIANIGDISRGIVGVLAISPYLALRQRRLLRKIDTLFRKTRKSPNERHELILGIARLMHNNAMHAKEKHGRLHDPRLSLRIYELFGRIYRAQNGQHVGETALREYGKKYFRVLATDAMRDFEFMWKVHADRRNGNINLDALTLALRGRQWLPREIKSRELAEFVGEIFGRDGPVDRLDQLHHELQHTTGTARAILREKMYGTLIEIRHRAINFDNASPGPFNPKDEFVYFLNLAGHYRIELDHFAEWSKRLWTERNSIDQQLRSHAHFHPELRERAALIEKIGDVYYRAGRGREISLMLENHLRDHRNERPTAPNGAQANVSP